jgi:hypothetical protein
VADSTLADSTLSDNVCISLGSTRQPGLIHGFRCLSLVLLSGLSQLLIFTAFVPKHGGLISFGQKLFLNKRD